MPIWTSPLPPLSDYVNHLARMHVIATIDKDPDLARFYEVDWQIIPNLMMDLTVPWLARLMPIYKAGQIFLLSTFLLIISGSLALNRAVFGRWSAAPLIAMPLLYNYIFLTGLVNYIFGIGLALWALACWIALRQRHWTLRLTTSILFLIALFFCHLSAVGIYGTGLLATEIFWLWSLRKAPLSSRLLDLLVAAIPFLAVIPLLLKSPLLQLLYSYWWEPRGKLDGLIYVLSVYSDITTFALVVIAMSGCAWLVRRNLLTVHPIFWILLVISGFVYLLMPRVMFATYMADQRLPIAFCFMLIACIDIDLRHRIVRRGFI